MKKTFTLADLFSSFKSFEFVLWYVLLMMIHVLSLLLLYKNPLHMLEPLKSALILAIVLVYFNSMILGGRSAQLSSWVYANIKCVDQEFIKVKLLRFTPKGYLFYVQESDKLIHINSDKVILVEYMRTKMMGSFL